MSLENLHCPQFVDFTATETFDINDGADYFFEKGVVGELGAQMDLGTFGSGGDPFSNEIQEITEKLSNMTNMAPKQNMPTNSLKDKMPVYHPQKYETKPVTRTSSQPEDKENQYQPKQSRTPQNPVTKAAETIGEPQKTHKEIASNVMLDSAISSAIEMIQSAKSSAKPQPKEARTPERPQYLQKSNSNDEEAKGKSTPLWNETNESYVTPIAQKTATNTTPEPPQNLDLSKPTAASLHKQKAPVINGGANPNIVKKTLAKMTAAFKPNKPVVAQSSSAVVSKRSNPVKAKPTSASSTEAMASRVNTANGTPKPLNTSRTGDESTSNESRLARPMSPEAGSNRRCSSVPRTLREHQALNNSRVSKSTKSNTFGEKLHNFFHSNNKASKQSKTAVAEKSTPKIQDLTDRRRSRSVNQSINVTRTGVTPLAKKTTPNHVRRNSQNDSMNATATSKSSYTKITASPSFSKPRQRSAERTVAIPQGVTSLYTGVKFVPNTNNLINIKKKYNENCLPAFGSSVTPPTLSQNPASARPASALTSALGPLPVEDILKNRPPCLAKNTQAMNTSMARKAAPFMRTTPGKSASFRSQPTSNTSMSVKPSHRSNVSDLNLSVDKVNLNGTGGGFRVRKQSDSSMGGAGQVPGLRHTELRALKRQEYDQQMKEKEKHAAIIKHELDQEKLRKQAEEIQKIRNQRNFRSNPIKHYKPITLKPSEKSLTEPKSPNLSISISKLNEISRQQDTMSQSSHRLSMALVDAPLGKRNGTNKPNSSVNHSDMPCKARTVSQNDLRF